MLLDPQLQQRLDAVRPPSAGDIFRGWLRGISDGLFRAAIVATVITVLVSTIPVIKVSTLPAFTAVSLSNSLRTWWSIFEFSALIWIVSFGLGAMYVLMMSARPPMDQVTSSKCDGK